MVEKCTADLVVDQCQFTYSSFHNIWYNNNNIKIISGVTKCSVTEI